MLRWPERSADLLLLTFAAGDLDAIACLRGHAFTANMTGNTVLLGWRLLGQERARAVSCLVALAGFLAGAAALALGVQSVAVRRLRISGVVTTFITGTITAAVVAVRCRLVRT